MEQNMHNIINSEEEIANSAAYADMIRYAMVNNQVHDVDDDTYNQNMQLDWSRADQPDALKKMSAVCFLFARNIYDQTNIPQGLVTADWGGTPVEAWSPQSNIDGCSVPDYNGDQEAWVNTHLWNGMVASLTRTSVKGFLWYQGEANGNYNRDLYNCTFPGMIQAWRERFSAASATDPSAPFGFVQLAPWRPDTLAAGFPVIRWHQTKDMGFVPNKAMENVFMSSPLDTFDPKEGYPGGIHPRYKQIAAERLAIAGLNVAYGLPEFPSNGPFPAEVILAISKEMQAVVTVIFDADITYNDVEISGFYYCEEDIDACDEGTDTKWVEIPKESVSQTNEREMFVDLSAFNGVPAGNLAYLWRESPVKKLKGLPIYASDAFRLPAAPWKFRLVEDFNQIP